MRRFCSIHLMVDVPPFAIGVPLEGGRKVVKLEVEGF